MPDFKVYEGGNGKLLPLVRQTSVELVGGIKELVYDYAGRLSLIAVIGALEIANLEIQLEQMTEGDE